MLTLLRWILRLPLLLLAGGVALVGLVMLGGCDIGNSGYRKRDGQWLYDDNTSVPCDMASFVPIDKLFGRDAQRGYYRGRPIDDSDGRSFEVLSEHEARDARQVYWADTYRKGQEYYTIRHVRVTVIAEADAARYRALGHDYGSDGRHAYYEGLRFAVRDAASFQPIDYRFARDAQRGYFERQEIPGSDGAHFALVDVHEGAHAHDGRRVYHAHVEINDPNRSPHPVVRVLAGAQPATVRVLGGGYAADGARAWWRGQPMAGADGATLTRLEHSADDGADASDGRYRYKEGKRLGS